MTPRIVTCVFAAAALFGVTACSETPSDPAATTTTDSTMGEPTTASEEPSAIDSEAGADEEQSVAEACLGLSEPLSRAGEELSDIASGATGDPQEAVDLWSEIVEIYEDAADSVSNAEVEAAARAASEDVAKLRDQVQKVFVDQDMGAMDAYNEAVAEFEEAQTELMELCAG